MRYVITSKTTIEVGINGNYKIIDEKSFIEEAPVDIKETAMILTESQKKYNYITLGRKCPIQLEKEMPITVIHEKTERPMPAKTHKSQLNRIDGMKKILDNYEVGDTIYFQWNPNDATLYVK